MNDYTSFDFGDARFEPGDELTNVYLHGGHPIVLRHEDGVVTYRARRWYDTPRLWLRALWRVVTR